MTQDIKQFRENLERQVNTRNQANRLWVYLFFCGAIASGLLSGGLLVYPLAMAMNWGWWMLLLIPAHWVAAFASGTVSLGLAILGLMIMDAITP